MTHEKRYALLSVALLVFFAGCGGVMGGSDQSPEPTSDSSTEQITMELPPGVSADEVNGSLLVDAHRAAVGEQSFAASNRYTIGVENFSTDRERKSVFGSDAALATTQIGSQTTTSTWYGSDSAYTRTVDNGTERFATSDSTVSARSLLFLSLVRTHVTAGEFTVDSQLTVDGREAVVLTADSASDPAKIADYYGGEELVSYEASAYVTEEGLITRLDYNVTVTDSDINDTVTYEGYYTVSDVGTATVDEPSWLSEARDSAVSFEVVSDSGGMFAVEMTAGDPIESGTRVDVGFGERIETVELPETVATGDVVYFTVASDETVVVSVGSEPTPTGAQFSPTFVAFFDGSETPVAVVEPEN